MCIELILCNLNLDGSIRGQNEYPQWQVRQTSIFNLKKMQSLCFSNRLCSKNLQVNEQLETIFMRKFQQRLKNIWNSMLMFNSVKCGKICGVQKPKLRMTERQIKL